MRYFAMILPGYRILSAGIAVLISIALANAQAAPNLFVDARPADGPTAKDAEKRVAQLKQSQAPDEVRVVGVELPLLSAPGKSLTFNLPGTTLSVSGAPESRTDKGFTWIGKVAGDK